MKTIIATADAPPAIGPYAQAVKINDTLYVSGQLPMDARTGKLVGGSISAQTEQVLINMREILEEGGAALDHVVKVTIYLRDLNDFDEVNKVYALYFNGLPPARSTVEVARLPRDAAIEMDCIAVISAGGYDPELF
ncbi:MAG TPA: RidA family protein [Abditibacteriaceae bacterium]|jgi:2-iminobutanoate/2-iminopropanoate deaminase